MPLTESFLQLQGIICNLCKKSELFCSSLSNIFVVNIYPTSIPLQQHSDKMMEMVDLG